MAKQSKQIVPGSSDNASKATIQDGKTAKVDVKGKGKAAVGSEIDDIFAGNSRGKEEEKGLETATEPASIAATPSLSKKKLKKRKLTDDADHLPDAATKQEEAMSLADLEKERKKRKQKPVEVVDTSDAVLAGSTGKKPKRVNAGEKTVSKEVAAKQAEEDELFRDSRGTSNRRQTDDGLAIYDINELNIGKGGDTALCPFDCECCF